MAADQRRADTPDADGAAAPRRAGPPTPTNNVSTSRMPTARPRPCRRRRARAGSRPPCRHTSATLMVAARLVGTASGGAGNNGRGFSMNDDLFAQFTASAGNGGVATSGANGGAASLGNINSGGNAGNAIGVGNTNADPTINGGSVSNNTGIGVSANGGTAIADASGGNYNLAFVS